MKPRDSTPATASTCDHSCASSSALSASIGFAERLAQERRDVAKQDPGLWESPERCGCKT